MFLPSQPSPATIPGAVTTCIPQCGTINFPSLISARNRRLQPRVETVAVANWQLERAVISDDYLEEVIKAYEHFFFHYTSSDLLIVNTSEIDFVERSEDLQALLRRVSEPIRGTQYFLPLGSDEQAARA